MLYVPKNFSIWDVVPDTVYKTYGDSAWQFLDGRAMESLDILIDFLGPLTVNNWKYGGVRRWSGFRDSTCPVGAANSQHRHGRAIDAVGKTGAKDMRKKILDNQELFPYVTTLEDNVDWLHFDIRQRKENGIILIKP